MSSVMLPLLCLPVALLAMRFGLAGGLAGAALAGAVALASPAFDDSGPLEQAAVIATYLLLAVLVGFYARRAAATQKTSRELEERLRRVAERDPLTDLFNRARFEQELERHVALTDRYDGCGALLMIDLDHFKSVNDAYGHDVGDDVLRATADALRETIRRSDVAARLGGDEFAVLLAQADAEAAQATAERLLEAMQRRRPARLAGGASVGVVLFGRETKIAPAELLIAADVALADAKQAGRGEIVIYAGQTRASLTWAGRLRTAIADDELVLFAQPIIDLTSGATAYHELLVRMLDDDGRPILPGDFLPTAERFGLMRALDRWVVQRALELAWEGESVGVNVSPESLADPAFLELLEHRSNGRGNDIGGVVFEVPETRAVEQLSVLTTGERLHDLGCRLAVDDFGTGVGSFSSFKHLPVDYLKIDIEFIRGAATSKTDERVVRSIVSIAQAFGVQSIAEGVEDQATLERLRMWGVDYAQGYHLGRPAPVTTPLGAA